MSQMFDKIQKWYEYGMWSKKRVQDAVGKWITQEECDIILSITD